MDTLCTLIIPTLSLLFLKLLHLIPINPNTSTATRLITILSRILLPFLASRLTTLTPVARTVLPRTRNGLRLSS